MKIAFTNSGTPEAYATYMRLSEIYGQCDDPKEAEVVVAIGGDGHMLDVLKTMEFNKVQCPVFGLNMGTVGYAMNDLSEDCLIERIGNAEGQVIRPLKVEIKNSQQNRITQYAWNEATVFRQTMQTLNISVSVGDYLRIKDIACDGMIFSTPFGSTAYNRSAGGPILPLESRGLALTPVSPARPRYWPGAVLPINAVVTWENLDPEKRPMVATFDSGKVEDALKVTVRSATRRKATLLFDPDHGLSERILREQFPF